MGAKSHFGGFCPMWQEPKAADLCDVLTTRGGRSQSAYQNLCTSRIASSLPLSDADPAANMQSRSQKQALRQKNRNYRRSNESQKAPPVDSLQYCSFSRHRSRTAGATGFCCTSGSASRFGRKILPPLGDPGTTQPLANSIASASYRKLSPQPTRAYSGIMTGFLIGGQC
jgi:hypothetical protein